MQGFTAQIQVFVHEWRLCDFGCFLVDDERLGGGGDAPARWARWQWLHTSASLNNPIWALYGLFERLRDPRWTNIPMGLFSIFVLYGGMTAMRFAMRAIVVGVFLAAGQGVVAAEKGSSWWPFGRQDDAATAQPQAAPQASLPPITPVTPSAAVPPATGPIAHETQLPGADSNDGHWMFSTKKTKVSWPKFQMPELPKPKSAATATKTEKKNTWVDKAPEPPKPSPFDSVKKGANSVAASTKSAWNKTVDAVTPGDKAKKAPPSPRLAQRETSPPFWKKMFGAKEPEMQQPQTVPQWMAQRGVGP